MRFSSSFKVGILTLIALFILLFTILWVKGRSFSSANRLEVTFKDVNGLRPGSGVQMMGLRVGQVEEITPTINGDNSSVTLKFVITEPGITIPKASVFSIQQSGLIGEQFLEITPPKIRTTYIPMANGSELIYKDDPVQLRLGDKFYDVGYVKNTQVMSTVMIPSMMQEKIKTKYAYKIDYIINMPGLILPDYMLASIKNDHDIKKMRIRMMDDSILPFPQQTSEYTVVEPMRIADFLDLQYKAAESLTEASIKVNDMLSDQVIVDLKESVSNINALTAQATTTMAKAEKLIDSSKSDIDTMITMVDAASDSFVKVANNVNNIIGDKDFKPTLLSATKSVDKLSQNINKVFDATDTKAIASDMKVITKNVSEITTFVNSMTKDEKLKKELTSTVCKVNKAMTDLSSALELVNQMSPADKKSVEQILKDTSASTKNLKKFTEKLNKRFLLFRLMF